MKKYNPQCAKCTVIRCSSKDQNKKVPSSCPTENYPDLLKDSVKKLNLPENQAVNKGWLGYFSKVVNPEKPGEKYAWTRIDEIIAYAKTRGMKKLGIATCYVLMPESKSLSEILENNGFTVISVCCLCGETNPGDIRMPGNICCNPILQAEILNREETELNMIVGLCLGHDILFLRYAKAETTPLIVKDRALGHNPVAALYQNQNPFYKDRFNKK
ncbi:MAG: DUF1847 domain-containing protein [Bacteroidales bacterium]|nr:DUF1847 domain-containing protein [Bacteroidales bacterium]